MPYVLRASATIIRTLSPVRLFTTKSAPVVVGVNAIIFKDNHILLGKRQNAIDAGTWGPPAGHIEVGEIPTIAACREAKEETGLALERTQLFACVDGVFAKEGRLYQSYFVFGTILGGEKPQRLEPHKCEGWEWFNVHRLPTPLFEPLRNLLVKNPRAFIELAQHHNVVMTRPSNNLSSHSLFRQNLKPVAPMRIMTVLFDIDRCIYNAEYLAIMDRVLSAHPNLKWGEFLEAQFDALTKANNDLYQQIAVDVSQYRGCDELRIGLFSARQSHKDDWINRLTGPTLTGSAHQALLMIKNRLAHQLYLFHSDINVDAIYLLLADSYANLLQGTAFRLALERMHREFAIWCPAKVKQLTAASFDGHSDWVFDDSKLTIIYAHAHSAAAQHPKATYQHNAYDDRLDILQGLLDFLRKHSSFIPHGTEINFYLYTGCRATYVGTVIGTGIIDNYYSDSIKAMVTLAGESVHDFSKIINVLHGLNANPSSVTQFLEWREEQSASTSCAPAIII